MKPVIILGNIAGYIIVCILYGRLVPDLSAPSIIGILSGGSHCVHSFVNRHGQMFSSR